MPNKKKLATNFVTQLTPFIINMQTSGSCIDTTTNKIFTFLF